MVTAGQSAARRRVVVSFNILAQLFLVLWIVLQLNAYGFQQSWQHDFTRDKRYVVPDEAKKLLARLGDDQHVEVVYPFLFAPNVEDRVASRLFDRAVRLCREFEQVNPRFRVTRIVDAARSAGEWEQVRTQYGIDQLNRLYLVSGEMRESLGPDDLARIRRPSATQPTVPFEIVREYVAEGLTSALQRLLVSERPRVYFTQGSGEPRLNAPSGAVSVEALGQALVRRGYDVKGLDLQVASEIPADTSLVIVEAAPTPGRPFQFFTGSARRTLEKYLDGGGALLLFAPMSGICGLENRLKPMGIELGDGSIATVGPVRTGASAPTFQLLVSNFDFEHPISRDLPSGEFRARMDYVRPIRVSGDAVSVLSSDVGSWIEHERVARRDAGDETGSFGLVAASEQALPAADDRPARTTRVVVFGTWAAAVDGSFLGDVGTQQLILNSVYWLTRREGVAAGAGRDVTADRIMLTTPLMRALFWTTIVVTPACAVLAGLVVFFVRRRT